MSAKNSILQGTLILTAVGFLCRFMGFFYRIFLSHTFGEESVGLYQLTFPVFALCISFTSAGLETAISRTVARQKSLHQTKEASETLCLGLFISCALSVVTLLIIQKNAAFFSNRLLGDPRCKEILILLSYALPFSSVHGCIMGYCYGAETDKNPGCFSTCGTDHPDSFGSLLLSVCCKKPYPGRYFHRSCRNRGRGIIRCVLRDPKTTKKTV